MKVREDNCNNSGMLELLLDAIGILSEKYVQRMRQMLAVCVFYVNIPHFIVQSTRK